jgi:hypothetical protein
MLVHFSHDRSNRAPPSFSKTTFKNFVGISDSLPEVSEFLQYEKLPSYYSILEVSKCNILVIKSLNSSPVYWRKDYSYYYYYYYLLLLLKTTFAAAVLDVVLVHNMYLLLPANILHSPAVLDLNNFRTEWLLQLCVTEMQETKLGPSAVLFAAKIKVCCFNNFVSNLTPEIRLHSSQMWSL